VELTRRALMLRAMADGWEPLFDGKSFDGWTLGDGGAVTHSWVIENGAIATVAGTRGRSDLLCTKPLAGFELEFEFKLLAGANTGVKYFVQGVLRYLPIGTALTGAYGAIGLEFQLAMDDAEGVVHEDQELGALYGLLPTRERPAYRVGEWARGRLVCTASRCEHWINGKLVLAFDPVSEDLRRRYREVATEPSHSIVGAAAAQVMLRRKRGTMPRTIIALQQHDSKAWFRALRVRALQ
jgi:hypothetical protein